ncbi:MAG: tRNA (guanosine(46)-N7)-methyltransferase TrmB [Pseudomonadota bacterium]
MNTERPERTGGERKLYGRRRSHKLRPGLARRIQELGPDLAVLPPRQAPEGAAGAPPAIDPAELFPNARALWLEIGFGGGEHLARQAAENPDVGLIGCEHYVDGVAKLLATIEREGLSNLRVHPHDARDVMDALPAASVARAFLLYPDPWPKKRHHKRRFVSAENFDAFARILAPGAELRVASDIDDYCRQALAVALDHPAFEWTAERPADWRAPWPGWPGTRYEAKALREGRRPTYLIFRRR